MSGRVAVVSTSYPRAAGDASGHFVAAEVVELVRAGHRVSLFVPGSGADDGHGARVHWLADGGAFGWPGALPRLRERPTRWFGACAFTWRAARALRTRINDDALQRVQAHFLVPCAWPIATLAIAASVPVPRENDRARACSPDLEIVGHGSDVRLFCALPRVARRLIARAWLRRNATLRVASAELAERLARANPELLPALRVQASPIDVSGVPDRRSARRSLGFGDDQAVALIVSRLVAGKRVEQALGALALLDDIQVVVVGNGPDLAPLRARFPDVRFTGLLPRPEALRFISAADVVVSASEQEGAPSVVREARALGVPVVAARAGDLADWAERDPGLLVVAGTNMDMNVHAHARDIRPHRSEASAVGANARQ